MVLEIRNIIKDTRPNLDVLEKNIWTIYETEIVEDEVYVQSKAVDGIKCISVVDAANYGYAGIISYAMIWYV